MTDTQLAEGIKSMPHTTTVEERSFNSLMEHDMIEGNKRITADLLRYTVNKIRELEGVWRHKESEGIYEVTGTGLAAVGEGRLVLMVHYSPYDEEEDYLNQPTFERQYMFFVEKFERVKATTVWEKAL